MPSLFATLSAVSEFLPTISRSKDLNAAIADGFAMIEKRGVRVGYIWMNRKHLVHLWKREEIFIFGDSHEESPLPVSDTSETPDEDTDFLDEILFDAESPVPRGSPASISSDSKRELLMQEIRFTGG
jgi:hypothetical protein